MQQLLSDADVAALCTSAVLLARHAARVAPREALVVTLAGQRFLRDGRCARLRPRTRARIAATADQLLAGERAAAALPSPARTRS